MHQISPFFAFSFTAFFGTFVFTHGCTANEKVYGKEEDNENDLEPYGWGLGFRTLIDLKKTNGIGNIGEFGWAGAAATYFLVDPKKELTAVLMTQVLNAEPQLKKDFVRTIYNNLD